MAASSYQSAAGADKRGVDWPRTVKARSDFRLLPPAGGSGKRGKIGYSAKPRGQMCEDAMEYRQIADDYSVAGQISPDDLGAIEAAGFRSVICNRPDGEQPDQPSAAEIKKAAEAAGLAFRHVPIVSGQPITPDDAAAMAKALDELAGPVFAYCRSGTRSANLFMAAQQTKR
jgi:uncharacterized protein (TIGR01244 family)